ncbi:hypothetical protein BUALT_Bualt03G0189700 [Buddleja alternifolia]|uniref:Uncharacterized protein n=1 Tax=Buddleja alternifolia TaxID=168488 RepID=A0AAV6Y5T2_9LAMI|nr:hypothetical protein BUALT_Bualt03G0189700 [Buddleja alternifolia]
MHLSVVPPPIIDPHVSVHNVPLKSPSNIPNPRLGKRKKGKGKPNIKKQQAIEVKLQTLMSKLNPIPFIPLKLLDFANHETLLKKLGLWDFVHIDFDRDIRVDLVAQLIATYEPKSRASYVNGFRIAVNRADLARAFKFPVKKEKGNLGGNGMELDLDWEVLTEDSIGFIVEFVSDWVLLHEDTWLMPNEVTNWIKVIRDGHPERVDWAGLVWFMVEKELTQGAQLTDCYYASHLQYLMKSQRGESFLREVPTAETVELDVEAKEEEKVSEEGDVKVGDAIDEMGDESCLMGGPSTELTLGQDGEKEEEMKEEEIKEEEIKKEEEMMDVEKCNESDEVGGREEQGQWLLHGKNDLGEHFMQRCSAENDGGFGSFEDRKEQDEEEEMEEEDEEEEGIHVFPNDDALDREGITGNLLEALEANQIAFTSQEQDIIGADMPPTSSFFNQMGKRVIDHDNDISHHALNDSNKRLRINNSWDHKPVDFGMCMEQIQQMTEKARMCYEEKEQAYEQANMNQQILLNELQKRDSVIEHLHKTRLEEIQKKDGEIYRLERELYLMGSVLDGYRNALKETQKVFAEYRERAQLTEEPSYKDAGPGGLMLSTSDIEKLRKKHEEEYKMNCLIIEQKMKEAEDDYVVQYHGFLEKINSLERKLTGLEADAKELKKIYAQRKVPRIEGKVPEVAEPQSLTQTEEVPEVVEPQLMPQTEEKMLEVEEPEVIAQTGEEKVSEVAEPLSNE